MHEEHERELAKRIDELRSQDQNQTQIIQQLQAERQREQGIIENLIHSGSQEYVSREHFEAMQKALREEHNRREKELWKELEATADVFMPKTKLQEMFNEQADQIEELRRLLYQGPEGPQKRFWDENLQTFIESQNPSPTGSTAASRRGSVAAMANLRRGSAFTGAPRQRSASISVTSSALTAARASAAARMATRRGSAAPLSMAAAPRNDDAPSTARGNGAAADPGLGTPPATPDDAGATAPVSGFSPSSSLRRQAFKARQSQMTDAFNGALTPTSSPSDSALPAPSMAENYAMARKGPTSAHAGASPSSSAPSSPQGGRQARTRFELELDLASKRQQHADTQAEVAQLESMQAALTAQESVANERIAAADRELQRYRKQHTERVETPTYMLPQGDFRRITSPNPNSDQLASGEEWMAQPHVQRLLRVKEEERAKVAELRRQIQTRVLDLRQAQQERPGDMSFDDKLAFFVTAAAPINEQLEEEYKAQRNSPVHPAANVAKAMNVKYDQSDC